MTRGDNKIVAFSRMLVRSEQLVTAACLSDDEVESWRWMSWATALASEWELTTDLKEAIADAARENALMGRSLGEPS